MPPVENCPGCGRRVDVGEILGVQVRGLYDGVLIWQHVGCGHRWPRFSKGDRYHQVAVDYLAAHADHPSGAA